MEFWQIVLAICAIAALCVTILNIQAADVVKYSTILGFFLILSVLYFQMEIIKLRKEIKEGKV
jgi:hypothetical protein